MEAFDFVNCILNLNSNLTIANFLHFIHYHCYIRSPLISLLKNCDTISEHGLQGSRDIISSFHGTRYFHLSFNLKITSS